MKHLLQAVAAATLLAASAPAFAQEAPPLGGAPALPGLPAPGADAAAGAEVTAATVIAAAEGIDTEITELGAVAGGAAVRVVPIADFAAGPDGAALQAALTAAEGKQEALRAAIQANSVVMAELQAQGVSLDSVVAVDVGADGAVTIFTEAA